MPVLALDHVNVTGAPGLLARCREFYVEVLGLSEGERPPFSRPGHWLYAGGQPVVHLVAGDSERHPGASALDHVAFTCGDIGDVVARLEARGIAFRRTRVPATGDEQLFVTDPAGVPIELRFPAGIPAEARLEENKALIRRWLAFADRGFDGDFGDYIAADFVGHLSTTPDIDRTELERVEHAFAAAFSGGRRIVHDLLADGDRVVLRFETFTTHTGEFHGIPPTNRNVRFTGMVIYRIHEGRIAESWAEIDFPSLMWQLRS